MRDGAVRFAVRVVPRAKRSAVEGVHGDALKVRLAAAPVDGAANDALVRVLALTLDVARSRVRIVHGLTSRTKTVEVGGFSVTELHARLARLCTE
jgi:hypothetical protein